MKFEQPPTPEQPPVTPEAPEGPKNKEKRWQEKAKKTCRALTVLAGITVAGLGGAGKAESANLPDSDKDYKTTDYLQTEKNKLNQQRAQFEQALEQAKQKLAQAQDLDPNKIDAEKLKEHFDTIYGLPGKIRELESAIENNQSALDSLQRKAKREEKYKSYRQAEQELGQEIDRNQTEVEKERKESEQYLEAFGQAPVEPGYYEKAEQELGQKIDKIYPRDPKKRKEEAEKVSKTFTNLYKVHKQGKEVLKEAGRIINQREILRQQKEFTRQRNQQKR